MAPRLAHGVAILCNYLLTAERLDREDKEIESCLEVIARALLVRDKDWWKMWKLKN